MNHLDEYERHGYPPELTPEGLVIPYDEMRRRRRNQQTRRIHWLTRLVLVFYCICIASGWHIVQQPTRSLAVVVALVVLFRN